jgi:hypothetical protein
MRLKSGQAIGRARHASPAQEKAGGRKMQPPA